jgi:hypothetical protein
MPAAQKRLADIYVNRAFSTVTMSAANTLTFQQIQFGVGLFQGVALVLTRVEWYLDNTSINELVANTDVAIMAITNRDDLATVDPSNQSVLAYKFYRPMMVGAVVGIDMLEMPLISDFHNLPGGGLIMPANPIYAAMYSAGFTGAGIVRVLLYFTFKSLTDAEYIELLQTIMPANL